MSKNNQVIVGLDIGTTKICAIVGRVTADEVEIIGIGTHPSEGLRKGVVVNIDSTVESIKKAIHEAEMMSGSDIKAVVTGIAGAHIKGFNSHGIIGVKDHEVSAKDVEKVLEAAKAVAIPLDREVVHTLAQEFIIDEQDGIRDPVGMSGVRLEVKVHIVTAAVASAQNIVRSCNRAGLEVADIVLQQIASSEAVLTDEEKELGVVVIDIGGGTTDIAVFANGSICYTASLPLGGNQLTSDIAVGLRTPVTAAEKIKKNYGCAMISLIDHNDTIEVPSVGGRQPRVLSRQILGEIIEPRMEEILELVKRELYKSGFYDQVVSGVVLTGGSSLMPGVEELAEMVFEMQARAGIPQHVGGLLDIVRSPMYATGVGLLIHGSKTLESSGRFSTSDKNLFNKLYTRMKNWFAEFF
ncbi:MAG: cell division protein FtsA [Deltaproteobacteria bacterium]|nr:cell division protein FtsA [Candidatus Anaeroferrophillus wilburensis]MBN2888973.1 cell division protein FtsA [Deltaproteobacteria bacterium]